MCGILLFNPESSSKSLIFPCASIAIIFIIFSSLNFKQFLKSLFTVTHSGNITVSQLYLSQLLTNSGNLVVIIIFCMMCFVFFSKSGMVKITYNYFLFPISQISCGLQIIKRRQQCNIITFTADIEKNISSEIIQQYRISLSVSAFSSRKKILKISSILVRINSSDKNKCHINELVLAPIQSFWSNQQFGAPIQTFYRVRINRELKLTQFESLRIHCILFIIKQCKFEDILSLSVFCFKQFIKK